MTTLVTRARDLAITMHEKHEHKRSNGEPYWHHPERVVATLFTAGVGEDVLAAAWLHDLAEDCPATVLECEAMLAELAQQFGPEVANLVREVTNFFPRGSAATMEQKQQRLIEHAPHLSDGAKWIKLSDRWDNISDMQGWTIEKRQRYARATLRLLEALRPTPAGADSIVAEIEAAAHRVLAA